MKNPRQTTHADEGGAFFEPRARTNNQEYPATVMHPTFEKPWGIQTSGASCDNLTDGVTMACLTAMAPFHGGPCHRRHGREMGSVKVGLPGDKASLPTMTVYVDSMRAQLGPHIVCHMIADTEEELHAMADAIGHPRRHYQGDHYDITWASRARAVALGAVEISMRQAGAMHSRRKQLGLLGAPDDAVSWLRRHVAARRNR